MDDIRYMEEEFINNEDEDITREDEKAIDIEVSGIKRPEADDIAEITGE
ncbi:MAG: hypothetical protein ACQEQV_07430 [Fibrobacterota bacterium]